MARVPPRREVECRSIHGQARRFPAARLRFRVAAYGVAVREGRVLLARSAFTGRWEPPGGAVEPWETLVEGLRREFAEETGVEPEPLRLFHVEDGFVYFFDHPFHSLRLYYLVRVPSDAPLRPQAGEVLELAWLDPEALPDGAVGDAERAVLRKARALAARLEAGDGEAPTSLDGGAA